MANPFVHIELSTDNPGKAKEFYGKLFKWGIEDMPMPDGTYTMVKPGEGPGGGMMKKMGSGDEEEEGRGALDTYGQPEKVQSQKLPDPNPEDVKRYDLDIMDFSKEQDEEEIDAAELDE